jgi:predicted nucleic acid-binding protein
MPSEVLVDSMILMGYDGGCEKARSWWEETVSCGVKIFLSDISLMERYKGIAKLPGSREDQLKEFDERISTMRREKKIYYILRINVGIARKAHELLRGYCLKYTPPQDRSRMEALICDMVIAATALSKGLPIVTLNTRDFQWITELKVVKPW